MSSLQVLDKIYSLDFICGHKDFFNIKEDIYDLKFSYDMDSKCIENTQAKDLVILKNNLIDDNIL